MPPLSEIFKIATTLDVDYYANKSCSQSYEKFWWEFNTGTRDDVNGDKKLLNFMLYRRDDESLLTTIHYIYNIEQEKEFEKLDSPHTGLLKIAWHYVRGDSPGHNDKYLEPPIVITTPDLKEEITSVFAELGRKSEMIPHNISEGDIVKIYTGNHDGSIPTIPNYIGHVISINDNVAYLSTNDGMENYHVSRLTRIGFEEK
jgi:hypothetical protein